MKRRIPTRVAVVVITTLLVIVAALGYRYLQPKSGGSGPMTREQGIASTKRWLFVKERWEKELADAKREGRPPREDFRPPSGQFGKRPAGMERFGPGSMDVPK